MKCWEYVRDNFDFIDTDNGVAAGASYGGFMINWIQGNPLGRKFKALVSHDGTFVADAKVSTDELWFIEHDVRISTPQCAVAKLTTLYTVQWHLLGESRQLPALGSLCPRAYPAIQYTAVNYPQLQGLSATHLRGSCTVQCLARARCS